MSMRILMKKIVFLPVFLFLVSLAQGAHLHGTIYNLDLEKVTDVLVELDTTPKQQYLAKDGEYSFAVPEGEYILRANKNGLTAEETIKIIKDGEEEFVYDLFLMPGFEEEEEILLGLEEIDASTHTKEKKGLAQYPVWSYLIALGIFLIAIGRIIIARRKYCRLRKKSREEEKEESEENKPAYLKEALELIKKHDGRIHQKELRKEMLYLSEAKVSLLLTELEHQGKIERIKKGRGKVIILKP